MRLLSILAAFALAQQTLATNSTSSTSPEQLFLEFSIHDVYDNTTGADFVEPWASAYVKSIQEKRYGDAIWARYHMYGDVENGIVEGSDNMTVLEVIEEDARDYRVDHSGLYTEALSFYAKTSSQDADTANVLDVLRRVGEEDITELEKRKTYGISCSTNWLAYYTSYGQSPHTGTAILGWDRTKVLQPTLHFGLTTLCRN
ncbi:hypothetical protein N7454_001573 [Penicillium verhagenii]|nr:hypothetical protein N7454_001573 [Penicillium verhagenii]